MNETVGAFFGWLVRASWQAAVLAGIVFLIQWAFGMRLNARWRYALWLLVLARLSLPISPHASWSLFNYADLQRGTGDPVSAIAGMPSDPRQGNPTAPFKPVPDISKAIDKVPVLAASTPLQITRQEQAAALITSPPQPKFAYAADNWFRVKNLTGLGIFIWALGVGFLGLRVIGQNIGFAFRLRSIRKITDTDTIRVFEECRAALGIRLQVGLVETNQVKSPALRGFLQPYVLLPEQMIGGFSPQELRFIFLHELAHVRRHDMAVHWLATALKIVHWFNPLLWLAFRRMAADRELACDEMALSHIGEQANKQYGQAILKVLEKCVRPPALPWVLGILEDKDQMAQRIAMILKFKRRSQRSALAVILLLTLGLITLTDAQTKTISKAASKPKPSVPGAVTTEANAVHSENTFHPDLLGSVQSEDGAPVRATVFIFTAGPKIGSSTFCPSCYLDCRKSAKSDAQGNFKIEALDPQLLFRVLVVAKGYEARFVAKVDPAKGPIHVELKVSDAAQAGPERSLNGRVLDSSGTPIVGAVVNSHGITRKGGGTTWGTLSDVDPLAVTDEKGEFLITAKEAFESMDLQVEARGFANRTFTKLTSGTKPHDLVMTEGAIVTGRVMYDGKPLPNVSVGVVSTDRGMENFTGNFDVGTGPDGRFSFVNLPADVDYFIYGLMKSLQPYGSIPIMKIRSSTDRQTLDVGDLVVGPGFRLSGRVVLADGTSVPPNTRLLVSREKAWDSIQLTLSDEGVFDASEMPRGGLSLSVRVPGYRVSAKNASLDRLNPFGLVGQIDRDATNLTLLMEKGPYLEPDFNVNSPESDWPQNRPLHGVEAAPDHSHEWLISGRVTDGDSQQPVRDFRVIPGNADLTWGKTAWDMQHEIDGTNGSYTISLDKRWGQPVLQVQADGYLPATISLVPGQLTSANTILKKGAGPSGIVLLPDGKPAPNISVLLTCADDQQPGRLDGKGDLNAYHNKAHQKKTDQEGRFSFAPELGMQLIAAASPFGFKKVTPQSLKTNPTIMLEPFGRIRGTLKRASGPAKGEELDLAFADVQSGNLINLANHAITDEQGRFEFDQVPAGSLQITSRKYIEGQHNRSWTNERLEQITLKPAESVEANITAPDRAAEVANIPFNNPRSIRVPDVQLKGQVFLPNGKPAADAQVALQLEGRYLALGKATLKSDNAREDGLIVTTDTNGEFTLPMYKGAVSVVALNEESFARVSIAELQTSPKIQLQEWGRIEGTLRIGRRIATNEIVLLSQPGFDSNALIYDFNDFQSKTDDQGHFVITYVPPGNQNLARLVPSANGSRIHRPLGEVMVKARGVTVATLGGTGELVIGKLKLAESGTNVDWLKMEGAIHSAYPNISRELAAGKTREEQIAYKQTPEFRAKMKAALKDFRSYNLQIASDGSFTSEEVMPGQYELDLFETVMLKDSQNYHPPTHFLHGEISVPERSDKSSNKPVDLGTIQIKLKAVETK